MVDLRALSLRAHRLVGRYRRLLSALLAAGAVLILVQILAPTEPASRPVVVAAHDLPGGRALSASDVRVVTMPPTLVPVGSSSSPDAVVGRVVAGPMRAGEVLTDVRVLGRALMAGFPRGTVAAPVRISDQAVVGLLGVGEEVDVYAARSDTGVADLVVGGVPVLALPAVDEGSQQGGLVVLAVTSGEAAALAGAEASAPLSLSLLG